MQLCLVCKKEIGMPHEGYIMGMVGWVCTLRCKEIYNDITKNCPQCQHLLNYGVKCKECQMVNKTYLEQAADLAMKKADHHKAESQRLNAAAKQEVILYDMWYKHADEVRALVPDAGDV